jgi:hypothetical protein
VRTFDVLQESRVQVGRQLGQQRILTTLVWLHLLARRWNIRSTDLCNKWNEIVKLSVRSRIHTAFAHRFRLLELHQVTPRVLFQLPLLLQARTLILEYFTLLAGPLTHCGSIPEGKLVSK